MARQEGEVTRLLEAWRRGEEDALGQLMELVQDELHGIARRLLRGERPDHTLQPTAMVNELYLRLEQQHRVGLENRAQLFAAAARAMRRVLVDHARRHRAEKRGGDAVHLSFGEVAGLPDHLSPRMLDLDLALLDLERRSPRQSRVVEMRLLVGLSLEEIATMEGVSPSTISRDWQAARLFLLRELGAAR